MKVGDDVDVKVLRVDAKDRKIGLSMRNIDDLAVPDDVQDLPIEGPEAEKAMEATKAAREAKKEGSKKKEKEKEEEKEGLRGGTGVAGPLFQLPPARATRKSKAEARRPQDERRKHGFRQKCR